jgi:diacylglycerol O-acyltransferase / wax synthase
LTSIDRLTDDDVRILRLEAGAIRGHTCKVLVLEPNGERPLPTLEELRAHVAARLDRAPRLRQRVVAVPLHVANPVWLDDPEFDIARHIARVETDGAVSIERLQELVAGLMARQLDHAHPLWHIDVVEPLEGGAMALVWRIHHAMADGTACMRFGSAVLWSDQPDAHCVPAPPWVPGATPGPAKLLASGLAQRARRGPLDSTTGRPRRGLARHPRSRNRLASLRSSRDVLERDLRPSATVTALAQPVGTERAVAFAQAPLADVKEVGKSIDQAITLNDVVLAIVTGGVRAWLRETHGPTEGIRAKVPVSLHEADERDPVANRDSYFFVDLPVAEPDPVKRLLFINRETTKCKAHHDAETLYRLGQHPVVAHWAMNPRIFTFNVSNVRGPASDLYVLGARVRALYPLAEIAQRHALRVAAISASGSFFFGLCADRKAVPQLQVLADGVVAARDELLALVS